MMPSRHSDAGAALLAVLFFVAIMSVAGLAVLEVTSKAINRARLVDAQAQSLWFVAGADEVGSYEIGALQGLNQLDLTLVSPVLTTPFVFVSPAGGTMTATVTDGSNCFNLNSVVEFDEFDEKVGSETQILMFRRLLESYGVGESESESLADALVDWIDDDRRSRDRGAEDSQYTRRRISHRTSGQFLENVSELRAIVGFEAELVEQLEPVVCARPTLEVNVYNINTMLPEHAPLLSAAFGGELSVFQAADIITNRPVGGWPAIEDLLAEQEITRIPETSRSPGVLSTRSGRLVVKGVATIGDARQNFTLVYSVATDQAVRTERRIFGEG